MVAYGDGFAVGLNNGSVQQWTGTEWKELHPWQTLVARAFRPTTAAPRMALTSRTTLSAADVHRHAGRHFLCGRSERPDRRRHGAGAGPELHIELQRGYFTPYDNKTTWAVRSWSGGPDLGAGNWAVTLYSGGPSLRIIPGVFGKLLRR